MQRNRPRTNFNFTSWRIKNNLTVSQATVQLYNFKSYCRNLPIPPGDNSNSTTPPPRNSSTPTCSTTTTTDSVHNISQQKISKNMLTTLSKGEKFIPIPEPISDKSLHDTVQDFIRSIRIRHQFSHNTEFNCNLNISDPNLRVINKHFVPNPSDPWLEAYFVNIQQKANNLCQTTPRLLGYKLSHKTNNTAILQSIQEIKNQTTLQVCSADKNLGFTVTTTVWYDQQAQQHLNNSTCYRTIDSSTVLPGTTITNMWLQLQHLLDTHNMQYNSNGTLTPNAKYILQLQHEKPTAGTFYLTIKMHKDPPTVRPIINSRNTPTYFASKYLHQLLAPVMIRCAAYLQNSKALIIKLEATQLNQSIYLVTADVRELYPSIPIEDGLNALRFVLTERMHWEPGKVNFIIALARFVLENNIFQYNNRTYLQIFGTAMGTPFAPAYATIYLHVIEIEVYTKINTLPNASQPLLIKRYIDDLFGIFSSKANADLYVELYNQARPTIKLQITAAGDSVDLLDLTIFKGPRFYTAGILDMKLYQKDMNRYLYIPPDSYHRKCILKNFILNEIRRARICCSSYEDYIRSKDIFYNRLLRRNYSHSFLRPLFDILHNREDLLRHSPTSNRSSLHTPTVFKIPNTPRFSHNQLKHLIEIPEDLHEHPIFYEIFQGRNPIICYKSTYNLKTLINKKHTK
jgi:hypothetical protein